jgi:hypothetical protein
MTFNQAILARAAPFAFYIIIMMISGLMQDAGMDVRWMYALRAGGTALLLIYLHSHYAELSWSNRPTFKQSFFAVLAGLAVFLLWISLNQDWMIVGSTSGYDPRTSNGALDIHMVAMRLAGAALVVPVMEELFWRSFIMRWLDHADFQILAPARVTFKALLISSVVFAIEHTFWLAGLFAGLIYGVLYIRTQNLWATVIAHAVTNGILGIWVVSNGQWRYW